MEGKSKKGFLSSIGMGDALSPFLFFGPLLLAFLIFISELYGHKKSDVETVFLARAHELLSETLLNNVGARSCDNVVFPETGDNALYFRKSTREYSFHCIDNINGGLDLGIFVFDTKLNTKTAFWSKLPNE